MTCMHSYLKGSNVMETFNSQPIIRKINENCENNCGRYGCLLWKGATFSGRYGRMRNPFYKHANQPAYMRIHRLVYLLHHIDEFSDFIVPKTDTNGQDLEVSHICHNRLCVNIDHLVLESHMTNCSRRECVAKKICCKTHKPECLL